MPLDDIFMLPKRVRTMEQMADLLQSERLMIERLEAVLAEMTRQGSINNNTPLTKQRLEEIASLFANTPCRVDEFPDELTIHIVVSRKEGFYTSWKEIVAGVDVLIPAHLKYLIVFELPVTVRIGVKASGYKIPYDLCGEGYAGELPWRNLVGTQLPMDVYIKVDASGHKISYGACGYTGELPWRNLMGILLPTDVRIAVDTSGHKILYDLCGEGYIGELPLRNLMGIQHSEDEPNVKVNSYTYQYDFCGTDCCGEEGV